jgi:KRAB domain-containing zinc finger protein
LFGEIQKLLEPFEQATRVLCGDKYATIGQTIPMTQNIIDYLNALKTEVPREQITQPEALELLDCLVDGVKTRFPNLESNKHYAIPTLLHPFYKQTVFTTARLAEEARKSTLDEMNKLFPVLNQSHQDENVPPVENQNPLSKGFSAFARIKNNAVNKRNVCPELSNEDELDLYLKSPTVLDEHVDVFSWWHINRFQFKKLYALTGLFLIIPASSASSERVFSAAGYLTDKRRNRLGNKGLNMLLFLKFHQVVLFLLLVLSICFLF